MSDEFWSLLKNQPGIGVLILDIDGLVLFCNHQAREIYYGEAFNPVGSTIAEIEGAAFAAERMPLIRQVIETGEPLVISHIRGGRHTEATLWPMQPVEDQKPRVIAVTRRGLEETHDGYPVVESDLVDLGPLDVLTRRELEVLTLVGHGVPLKVIATQLGVSQRTVERYRTDISRKLHAKSIAEIARLVQAAGIQIEDCNAERLHRWHGDRMS